MRSTTWKLMAVVLLVGTAAVVLHSSRGPTAGQKKQERVSTVLSPPSRESVEMQQRWRVKQDLTRRIIAERIPLLEAAALFADANGDEGLRILALTHSERSIQEHLCRQVIDYVTTEEREMEREGHTRNRPRVSEKLQREFDRRMAAGEFPQSSLPSACSSTE